MEYALIQGAWGRISLLGLWRLITITLLSLHSMTAMFSFLLLIIPVLFSRLSTTILRNGIMCDLISLPFSSLLFLPLPCPFFPFPSFYNSASSFSNRNCYHRSCTYQHVIYLLHLHSRPIYGLDSSFLSLVRELFPP